MNIQQRTQRFISTPKGERDVIAENVPTSAVDKSEKQALLRVAGAQTGIKHTVSADTNSPKRIRDSLTTPKVVELEGPVESVHVSGM